MQTAIHFVFHLLRSLRAAAFTQSERSASLRMTERILCFARKGTDSNLELLNPTVIITDTDEKRALQPILPVNLPRFPRKIKRCELQFLKKFLVR